MDEKDKKGSFFKEFNKFFNDYFGSDPNNTTPLIYLYMTISIVILILLILFGWIYDRLALEQRTCDKLEKYYKSNIGKSYFTSANTVVESSATDLTTTKFDISHSIFKNSDVKSAYHCCCGDGYKNNFVNLCALEKCISNGCRFLDFEIYSYNNKPIVASSTANSNYIKETYNSLDLGDVLSSVTTRAFDAIHTNCNRDPLILNFRVMSTNLTMLERMGALFEHYLDLATSDSNSFRIMKQHNYTTGTILNVKMSDLYKTVIVICDFYPSNNIIETNNVLSKLKTYINLKGKSAFCKTYRYTEIAGKTTQFIDETKRNYVIVLPNLNNSVNNNEFASAYGYGCNAIAMKYQTKDANLESYIKQFTNKGNFSWILKPNHLIANVPSGFAIIPFTTHRPLEDVGNSLQRILSEF